MLQSKNKCPHLSECNTNSTCEEKNSLNAVHRVRVSAKSLQNKDNRCRPLIEHCIKNSYRENKASRMRHQVLRASIKNIIKPSMGMDYEINVEQLGRCQTDFKYFKDYEEILQISDKTSLNSFNSKKTITVPFKSKTFSEKSLPVSDKTIPLSEILNVDYGQPLLLTNNFTLNLKKNTASKDKRKLYPKSNVVTAQAKYVNKIVAEKRYEILSKQKLLEDKNATENENKTENDKMTVDQAITLDSHRLKYSNTLLAKRRQEYISKQKFQADKFDKIEGLNWISWK